MARYLHVDYEKRGGGGERWGNNVLKQIRRKCLEKVEEDFLLTIALYL